LRNEFDGLTLHELEDLKKMIKNLLKIFFLTIFSTQVQSFEVFQKDKVRGYQDFSFNMDEAGVVNIMTDKCTNTVDQKARIIKVIGRANKELEFFFIGQDCYKRNKIKGVKVSIAKHKNKPIDSIDVGLGVLSETTFDNLFDKLDSKYEFLTVLTRGNINYYVFENGQVVLRQIFLTEFTIKHSLQYKDKTAGNQWLVDMGITKDPSSDFRI